MHPKSVAKFPKSTGEALQNEPSSGAGLSIILVQPEIPPNTGSIARLCAATKVPLHLVEPLGFSLADKHLKRAGLDYWPQVDLSVWPDFSACAKALQASRLVLTSAGNTGQNGLAYQDFAFAPGDALVFGAESTGLSAEIFAAGEHIVRIPIWGEIRSLNLANAASIILYEALRQIGALAGR